MFCDKQTTADARQIAITKVDKGSPADGILAVGDVILGVAGTSFSYDPRTELGKALTTAESEAGGGKLPLIRWRGGKQEDVVVMLLAEYQMATGDESFMPGLRRLALEAANGQSIVGSWGHKFAGPDGRLVGYGMMNAPGVPLTISLIMGPRRRCEGSRSGPII